MQNFEVIIIGAGSAGISARKEVSQKTDNYRVIDPGALGTTCARVGCMPSKVMIEAANIFHQRTKFERIGVQGSAGLSLDSAQFLRHIRKLRDEFVTGVKETMEDWKETHLIRKKARFVSENILDLEGEKVSARKIIIATGSTPIVPAAWASLKEVVTTDQFFELETLPRRIAVIGMGAIGLEMSQALARVGVEVSVFYQGDSIGGGLSDPEMVAAAKTEFSKEMKLYEEQVKSIQKSSDGVQVQTSSRTLDVDLVLVAIGRKPNIKGLGLENLKLDVSPNSLPVFSRKTFRISKTNLYFVGDVNADRPLLHEAAEQGRIAGYNSVHDQDFEFEPRVAFGITFSTPQIARVGKSYQQILNEKLDFVEGSASFENQGRARAKLENKGLIKIYGEQKTGLLLGAEIFAPEGEHLAHLLAWSFETNSSAFELLRRPFYHPVIEEGLRAALRNLARNVVHERIETDDLRCEDPPSGS
jgi:dihydrolipoamide dehydrogenase